MCYITLMFKTHSIVKNNENRFFGVERPYKVDPSLNFRLWHGYVRAGHIFADTFVCFCMEMLLQFWFLEYSYNHWQFGTKHYLYKFSFTDTLSPLRHRHVTNWHYYAILVVTFIWDTRKVVMHNWSVFFFSFQRAFIHKTLP